MPRRRGHPDRQGHRPRGGGVSGPVCGACDGAGCEVCVPTRWSGPLSTVWFNAPCAEPGCYTEYKSKPGRLLHAVDEYGIMVPTDSKKRGKSYVEVGTVAPWELIAAHIHHGLRHPAFRAHVEAELARVAADPSVVRAPVKPVGGGS